MSNVEGTGWFASPNAIFDSGLQPFELSVLMYLHRCAGPDGSSWPAMPTIAKACGMSRRRAVDACRNLEAAGWLTMEAREVQNGGDSSYLYKLRTPLQDMQPPLAGGATPYIKGLNKTKEKESVGFPEFWEAWRGLHKATGAETSLNKKPASEKFATALKFATAAEIMAGFERFAAYARWKGGRFVPMAETWLHQRRWESEYPVPQEKRALDLPRATDRDAELAAR